MASVAESDCHKDPNFAVICSFLDKYGELLGLPSVSYSDLERFLEDETNDVSRILIDIHVRLLRRIGKSTVNSERFEKSIIKFCHHFSEFDAWEVESYGYKHAKLSTKLRILKHLLECQFDFNLKFKEKVNESQAEDMRFLPIGRDKDGQAYWYLLDKDLNLLVYREEQDDEDADTWELVCRDRQQLASLVNSLQTGSMKPKQEEEKTSSSGSGSSRSSKEGSPEKETGKVKSEEVETKVKADPETRMAAESNISEANDKKVKTDGEDDPRIRMRIGGNTSTILTDDKAESGPCVLGSSSERVGDRLGEDTTAKSVHLSKNAHVVLEKINVFAEGQVISDRLSSDKTAEVMKSTDESLKRIHASSADIQKDITPCEEATGSKSVPSAPACSDTAPGSDHCASVNTESQAAAVVSDHSCKESSPVVPSDLASTSDGSATKPHPSSLESKESEKLKLEVTVKQEVPDADSGNSTGVKSVEQPVLNLSKDPPDKQGGKEGIAKDSVVSVNTSEKEIEKSEGVVNQTPNHAEEGECGKESLEQNLVSEKSTAPVSDQPVVAQTDKSKDSDSVSTTCGNPETDQNKKTQVKGKLVSSSEPVSEKETTGTKSLSDSEQTGTKECDNKMQVVEEKEADMVEKSKVEAMKDSQDTSVVGAGGESSIRTSQLVNNSVEDGSKPSEFDKVDSAGEGTSKGVVVNKETTLNNVLEKTVKTNGVVGNSVSDFDMKCDSPVPASKPEAIVKDSQAVIVKSSDVQMNENSSSVAKSEETGTESVQVNGKETTEPVKQKSNVTEGDAGQSKETPVKAVNGDGGDSKAVTSTESEDAAPSAPSGEAEKTEVKSDGAVSAPLGNKMTNSAEESEKSEIPEKENEQDAGDSNTCEKESGAQEAGQVEEKTADSSKTSEKESVTEKVAQTENKADDSSKASEKVSGMEEIAQTEDSTDSKKEGEKKSEADDVAQIENNTGGCGLTQDYEDDDMAEDFDDFDNDDAGEGHEEKKEAPSASISEVSEKSNVTASMKPTEKCSSGTEGGAKADGLDKPKADGKKIEMENVSAQSGGSSSEVPMSQENSVQDGKDGKPADGGPDKVSSEVGSSELKSQEKPEAQKDVEKSACSSSGKSHSDVTDVDKEKKLESENAGTVSSKVSTEKSEDNQEGKEVPSGKGEKMAEKTPETIVVKKSEDASTSEAAEEESSKHITSTTASVGESKQVDDLPIEKLKNVTDTAVDEPALKTDASKEAESVSSGVAEASDEGSQKKLEVGKDFEDSSAGRQVPGSTSSSTDEKTDVPTIEKTPAPSGASEEGGEGSVAVKEKKVETSEVKAEKEGGKTETNEENSEKEEGITESSGGTVDKKDEISETAKCKSGNEGVEKNEKEESKAERNKEKHESEKEKPEASNANAEACKENIKGIEGKCDVNEKETRASDGGDNVPKKSSEGEKEAEEKEKDVSKEKSPEKETEKLGTGEDGSMSTKTDEMMAESSNVKGAEDSTNKEKETRPEDEERKKSDTGDTGNDPEKVSAAVEEMEKNVAVPGQPEDEASKQAGGESQRKLKRSAPDAASDEPVESEPNGKRARPAAKNQKTRGGRNAAARGRAARLAEREVTESEDSEAAVTSSGARGRGKLRGRGGRGRRGRRGGRRGGRNTGPGREAEDDVEEEEEAAAKDDAGEEMEEDCEDKGKKDSAAEEADENTSDQAGGKRPKKKKPDSSSEALSEDEVTPAKKGRSQLQPARKAGSANRGKRGGGRGRGGKSTPSTPATAAGNEAEGSGRRRSMRVREMKAKRPPTPPSPPSSHTEEESEDDLSDDTEEEVTFHVKDKDFLDPNFTPEEESGDEDFKPKGRNFQRQAQRTIKGENEEVVNDDTPCVKCGKYNHPEMILLCDKCDAGYHTACLRPPLMLIPDGDWFCPPCEHSMLVCKLLECLQTLDTASKKKDRLSKRQERLAYVGISISNILHGNREGAVSGQFDQTGMVEKEEMEGVKEEAEGEEKQEGENEEDEAGEESGGGSTSYYESEGEELQRTYRSERLSQRQAQKRSRMEKKRRRRPARNRSPEVEVFAKRTCRTRSTVSYQFKEFDELISNAIEDDKPCRKEKPPEGFPFAGISRGKDMSNILGASDEEDEKIRLRDGDSGPPPVVRKKTKRKLTKLDSDEEQEEEEEDESEEFKLSEEEDSEATEIEGEEEDEGDEEEINSDSGDWKPKKTWFNSRASSRKSSKRMRDFVVEDEDYDSDENATKRRSTRNSTRGRIRYNDWESEETEQETDEEEASFSDFSSDDSKFARKMHKEKEKHKKAKQAAAKKKKKKVVRRGKHFSSEDEEEEEEEEEESGESQSDSSLVRRRKLLQKLVKKRRKDATDSDENEEKVSEKKSKASQKVKKKRSGKYLSDESEEESDNSDDEPRFKKKNVLRSSDEEEEEGDEEKDGAEEATGKKKSPSKKAAAVVAPIARGAKSAPKGKKRGEKLIPEDAGNSETVANQADEVVPGKIRRLSGSDREGPDEPNAKAGSAETSPAKGGKKKGAGGRQTRKQSAESQAAVEEKQAGKAAAQRRASSEKSPRAGKKKKVPNFLDVPSGDESEEDGAAPAGDALVAGQASTASQRLDPHSQVPVSQPLHPQAVVNQPPNSMAQPPYPGQMHGGYPPGFQGPQPGPGGQYGGYPYPGQMVGPPFPGQRHMGPGMGSPTQASSQTTTSQGRSEMGSPPHTMSQAPGAHSGHQGLESSSMRAAYPGYGGGLHPGMAHDPRALEPGQIPPGGHRPPPVSLPHGYLGMGGRMPGNQSSPQQMPDPRHMVPGMQQDPRRMAPRMPDPRQMAPGGVQDPHAHMPPGRMQDPRHMGPRSQDPHHGMGSGMTDPRQMPPGGVTDPRQMPPGGVPDPRQMPPGGVTDPRQMPPGGVTDPRQMPPGGVTDPRQMPPGGVTDPRQMPPGMMHPGMMRPPYGPHHPVTSSVRQSGPWEPSPAHYSQSYNSAARMVNPQEMGPGGMRHPYPGMRSPPPSHGQYMGQYPGMGPIPPPTSSTNSPLSSMGQMARNLGENAGMQSPPHGERRPSMGSPSQHREAGKESGGQADGEGGEKDAGAGAMSLVKAEAGEVVSPEKGEQRKEGRKRGPTKGKDKGKAQGMPGSQPAASQSQGGDGPNQTGGIPPQQSHPHGQRPPMPAPQGPGMGVSPYRGQGGGMHPLEPGQQNPSAPQGQMPPNMPPYPGMYRYPNPRVPMPPGMNPYHMPPYMGGPPPNMAAAGSQGHPQGHYGPPHPHSGVGGHPAHSPMRPMAPGHPMGHPSAAHHGGGAAPGGSNIPPPTSLPSTQSGHPDASQHGRTEPPAAHSIPQPAASMPPHQKSQPPTSAPASVHSMAPSSHPSQPPAAGPSDSPNKQGPESAAEAETKEAAPEKSALSKVKVESQEPAEPSTDTSKGASEEQKPQEAAKTVKEETPSSAMPQASKESAVSPDQAGPASSQQLQPSPSVDPGKHGYNVPYGQQGQGMPPAPLHSQQANMPPAQQSNVPSSQPANMPPSQPASVPSSQHGTMMSSSQPASSHQGPTMPASQHISNVAPGHPQQRPGMPPGQYPPNMPPNSHSSNMPYYHHPYFSPYGPNTGQPIPAHGGWGSNMPPHGANYGPNMYMNQRPQMYPPHHPAMSQQEVPQSQQPGQHRANTPEAARRSSVDSRSSQDEQPTRPVEAGEAKLNQARRDSEGGHSSAGESSSGGVSGPPPTAAGPPSSTSSNPPSSSTPTSSQSDHRPPPPPLRPTDQQHPPMSSPDHTPSGGQDATPPASVSSGGRSSSLDSAAVQSQPHGAMSHSSVRPPPNAWPSHHGMHYPPGPWPGMGGPSGQYSSMMQPYGGGHPGMMRPPGHYMPPGGHPHGDIPGGPSQRPPPGPNPGGSPNMAGQRNPAIGPDGRPPYMPPGQYPGCEPGTRPPPHGMEPQYPRPPGFNQGPPAPHTFQSEHPAMAGSAPPNPADGEQPGALSSASVDQSAESNSASKPKKAKTQKKVAKDGPPVRGKSAKSRGRGRGGFMIDNLLQSRGAGGEEEGEDNAEMKDIVSYVATDDYFKQQTSS
ncbi:uncharacterized protein LOC101854765 isoform X3 [Aplysia californica]|uniref:Uncharacterized protein LOC101854765 isoform X3 n=1 Tax=Aplysia californica TaxID=6500 RepID=A0ABM0K8Q3_APLCA|nr:uncharacterized protein LOC101854765 isoform X3 [Aplysia californica]